MASTSKTSKLEHKMWDTWPKGGDWRYRGLLRIPTKEELDSLQLPFEVVPEKADYVNATFTKNVKWLATPQEGAPWTGYYGTLNGAKVALASYCGVWFEIEKSESSWQAIRVARLTLDHSPIEGLNWDKLVASGAPTVAAIVEAARSASRSSQHDAAPPQEPEEPKDSDAPITPAFPGRHPRKGLGAWPP